MGPSREIASYQNAFAAQGYSGAKKIGEGQVGWVFRAKDIQGGPAALKVLRPSEGYTWQEAKGELLHEYQIVRMLLEGSSGDRRAQHIITHYHLLEIKQGFVRRPVIVMDYHEGGTLTSYLEGRMTSKRLRHGLSLLEQAVQAAELMSEKNIAHHDLKPANIIQGRYGAVITDFGNARVLSTAEDDRSSGYGTRGYIAPERKRLGKITPIADIYALGIILYHICGGRQGIEGIEDHAAGAETLAHISPSRQKAAWELIAKATEPDPARRISHIGLEEGIRFLAA